MNRAPSSDDTDAPLRNDVRLLGSLLGEVLKETRDEAFFNQVEASRLTARRHRDGDPSAAPELWHQVSGLPASQASELTRAFSSYFGLVNMAEQVHRIRRRRDHQRLEGPPQRGSLEAVLATVQAQGIDWPSLQRMLQQMQVQPVFTAHPSRAIRRALLAKDQHIARALVTRLGAEQLTPLEKKAIDGQLLNEIGISWQTEEQPAVQATVADEAEYVLFYLTDVVYRIIPPFYEALADAIHKVYGEPLAPWQLPTFLRFGSWVGGDMDGNPNVGADTIRATLQRHRQLILRRYQAEVRELFGSLTQSLSRVNISSALERRLQDEKTRLQKSSEPIPERYAQMPYREFLWAINQRLEATAHDGPDAYSSAKDFLQDLPLIADSLRSHQGLHAGLFGVERLLRRAQTFGFHLATLDVRQDALVHRQAVGRLLGIEGFENLSPTQRLARLEEALHKPLPSQSEDPLVQRSIDVMRAISQGRARYGSEAIGPYIISMAQQADDALAVLVLARAAELVDKDGQVPLDISPLFETIEALAGAPASFQALLANPSYRQHLAQRGQEQLVMVGYSDSNKDGGITMSRWALYQAQDKLLEQAQNELISITFFHGRGGTTGRGGSKPREAILGEPAGAVHGRLRVTEQGEIIHAKYGLRGIATRTLELMTGAVIQTTACTGPACYARPAWLEVMQTIAQESYQVYKALVHDNPNLFPYFRSATPIDVIERMHIGSRPPSRRAGKGVQDLRAIPWVFAWTQNRQILPGWYAVGAGLEKGAAVHGLQALREMRHNWAFFANFISDVEMVLAKADLKIGARYAELAAPATRPIFALLQKEYENTIRWVLEINQSPQLLETDPVLRRSIALRNPYIDPMSLIQVDLLARWRETERSDPELEQALFNTVRGIARGMQNTG